MIKKILHAWFKAVFPLLLFYTFFIGVFLTGRLALLAHCYPRIVASGVNYWLAFLIGWRMDIIAVCIILALPTLVIFLTPSFLRCVAE